MPWTALESRHMGRHDVKKVPMCNGMAAETPHRAKASSKPLPRNAVQQAMLCESFRRLCVLYLTRGFASQIHWRHYLVVRLTASLHVGDEVGTLGGLLQASENPH